MEGHPRLLRAGVQATAARKQRYGLQIAADVSPSRRAMRLLAREEQRDMLARREVIPLADAIRAARPQDIGDVLRAQLCRGPQGRLAYVLTLLPRNGKVTRVLIDASNGNVISGG